MEIKEIIDSESIKKWNNFIIQNSSPAAFLQSWEWGEFKKNLGENVLRYAICENNELIAVAQFFKVSLPGGKFYLNCPKGPIIKIKNQKLVLNEAEGSKIKNDVLNLLINKIKEIVEQEKIIFFRIAPPLVTQAFRPDWSELKLEVTKPKILTNLVEPENTLILDLQKSEDEILKNMHPKTRYNIKLAERKGIRIMNYESPASPAGERIMNKEIDIFYKLLKETAQRDKINIFNKDYYNKLLITNYPEYSGLPVTLFIAEYNYAPLSAIIVIGFGDTVTYLYGASSNKYRELMPNYLIQWQAIKWAKNNNYKYYDLWGISKQKEKWAGITRFKQGFVNQKTGQEINYLGTFDYILNKKWYNLYKAGKILSLILPL